jgi:hypothetical protein
LSRASLIDSKIHDFHIGTFAQNGSFLRLARTGAGAPEITGWSREAVRIVDGSVLTIDGAFDANNRYVIGEPVANTALLNAITLFNSSARLRLVDLQYGAGFAGMQLLNGSKAHVESVRMQSSAAIPGRSVWLGDLSHVYFANFLGRGVGPATTLAGRIECVGNFSSLRLSVRARFRRNLYGRWRHVELP